ncbi:type II toxin-antitoxin system RelE/ParE family toxin [Methylobacterium sp. J-070]|uniref:type II toxin-antitoxin system RelE/ParE family toxin n=1 Tax=Methylobacterium sp. J-070 TaxID=2836650 RepID=UPI002445229B
MTSGSSPRSIAVTIDVRRTPEFIAWLTALRDIQGRARITERIDRLAGGNSGDARSVGDGVSELRLDFGPGYRIDHKRRGDLVVILPCGGDKGSQAQDIERAKAMAREV